VPNAASNGTKFGPVTDATKAKKDDILKEPLGRMSSIPNVEAPQPPKKVVPKMPEARPAIETDDHKVKNMEVSKDGNNQPWRSGTLDRAVGQSDKPLKPLTADRSKPPGRRAPTNNAALRDGAPSETEPPVAVKKEKDEKPNVGLVPIKEDNVFVAPKKETVMSPGRQKGSLPELPGGAGARAADSALAELQSEVHKLRADLESLRQKHDSRLAELTTELDEEKKMRLNLQVEIDRLKKRLAD